MTHKPFSKVADEFFKKMEDHAKAEGIRLRKPTHGKLRLIGTAIGVVVVILLAVWMAYNNSLLALSVLSSPRNSP